MFRPVLIILRVNSRKSKAVYSALCESWDQHLEIRYIITLRFKLAAKIWLKASGGVEVYTPDIINGRPEAISCYTPVMLMIEQGRIKYVCIT